MGKDRSIIGSKDEAALATTGTHKHFVDAAQGRRMVGDRERLTSTAMFRQFVRINGAGQYGYRES